MIPVSDVFLQYEADWIFQKCFLFVWTHLYVLLQYVCLWILRLLQLWQTVQGSLAGTRVCEHTAMKRSHCPAYHLHDNLLTAHQGMMTGNDRLPLAWHLHYLLVFFTAFPIPLFPTQLTYSLP